MTLPITWINKPDQYTDNADIEFEWSVDNNLQAYYRLAPVEQDWQGPISATRLIYRELPEGQYTFYLAVCEQDGSIGLGDEHTFYIVHEIKDEEPMASYRKMPDIETISQPIDIRPGKSMSSTEFNQFVKAAIHDIEELVRAQANMRGYIGETRTMWGLEAASLTHALDDLELAISETVPNILGTVVQSGREFDWPMNILDMTPGVPDSLLTWFDDVSAANIDMDSGSLTAGLINPPAERFAYRHPISGEVYTRSDISGYVEIHPIGYNAYHNDPTNAINYDVATAWIAAISQPQTYTSAQSFDFVIAAPGWYSGNVLSNSLCLALHPAGSLNVLAIEYSEQTGTAQAGDDEYDWTLLPTYPTEHGEPLTINSFDSLVFKFKPIAIGSIRVRVCTNNATDAGTMKRYVAGIKHLSMRQELYVSRPSYVWCILPSPLSPATMYRIVQCTPRITNQSELTAGYDHVRFAFFRRNAEGLYDPLPIGRKMMPIIDSDAAIVVASVHVDPHTHVTPLVEGIDVTFQRV